MSLEVAHKQPSETTCGVFVTGTDTGVGKTYVASTIARQSIAAGIRVGAYKPVCTGCESDSAGRFRWPDIEQLSAAIGDRFPAERVCPQRFRAALAPPVAARMEGARVDGRLLRSAAGWWWDRVDLLVVEGVGGLLCPIAEGETVADVAGDLGFPLIIVARSGLGTINHTLLTVEAARTRGLPVAGIVLNRIEPQVAATLEETNLQEIAARCEAPVLGIVGHGRPIRLLRDGCEHRMNWVEIAGCAGRSSGPANGG